MQETEFISQNKGKWSEFESVLHSDNKDPHRLTQLFIETTDDLSYSRTFYPNRSIRVYLNGISQQIFQAIYRNKAKGKNVFSSFWKKDLPEAMWHHRGALLQSFLVFVLGLTIGIASSIYYPDFARIILGEDYIAMTEANIDSGDPMAVYKDDHPLEMFVQIAVNNILISFITFILGIFFGLGTYYVVFYNAIMVGAFVYFFIERGLFRESFLAIMLHGTLELSMIVIAGCAGLVLARGLLFPGTYTRLQALAQSARNGITIMIGVTVFLVYAALIESFITRITRWDGVQNGQLLVDAFRLMLILISAAIVLGYFVFYPRYLHRKGLITPEKIHELPYKKEYRIDEFSIRGIGRIFTESFYFFSKSARKIILFSIFLGLIITLFFGISTGGNYNSIIQPADYFFMEFMRFIWVWSYFNDHLNFELYPLLFLLLILLSSLWIYYVRNRFLQIIDKPVLPVQALLKALLPSLLALSPLLFPHFLTIVLFPLTFPLGIVWYCVAVSEKLPILSAFQRTLLLLKGNWWSMVGAFLLLLSIQWISFFILSSFLLSYVFEFIRINIPHTFSLANQLGSFLNTFLLFTIPAFMFSLTVYAMGLFYFSIREINTAGKLSTSVASIGTKKRSYGLEQEL
ncbi:MAG: stage II sporulation protein M [Crocinitomicaceae bacterium]|nr:stage II sporulation protein M [Crocinitomicaceae bacterium]